jgi:alkyl hydroperoxide reductase subunit AhpF
LSKQKSLLLKSAANERENLTACYEVCLELVKHKKSFRDGALIKRCAIKMANVFSGRKIAEKFKTVLLSYLNVSRRVSKVADSVSDTQRCVMNNCQYVSMTV